MQYSGAGQQGPRKDTDSCPKKKHDIIYILAANYDQKHLENTKIRLENSWIFFFFQKDWDCQKKMA